MAKLIKRPPLRGETSLPLATLAPASRPASTIAKAVGASASEAAPQVAVPQARPSPTAAVTAMGRETENPAPGNHGTDHQAQALAKAREEALSALEDTARREGYAAGSTAGEREGLAKYAEALATLDALIRSANAGVAAAVAEAEELIGAIVFEAVGKIVGAQLATPAGARAVVAEIVSRVKREDLVAVKVSAADLARLRGAAGEANVAALDALPLEASDAVGLGGCLVELKGGRLDGRIETQFRAFAQSLKEAAHRR